MYVYTSQVWRGPWSPLASCRVCAGVLLNNSQNALHWGAVSPASTEDLVLFQLIQPLLKPSCPISTYLYSICVKVFGHWSNIKNPYPSETVFLIEKAPFFMLEALYTVMISAVMVERPGLEVCYNSSSILQTFLLGLWKALYLSALCKHICCINQVITFSLNSCN